MNKSQLAILLIEDDLIIAQNLKENLGELGYENILITTSEEEVQKIMIDGYIPDIIFTDIDLGKGQLTGIDIIKKYRLGGESAIILLTSYSDKEYVEEASLLGVSSYLIKPASIRQIDVAIDLSLKSKNTAAGKEVSPSKCPFFIGNDHCFVKTQKRFEKLHLQDIVYLKAAGSYCSIETNFKSYLVSMNLGKLLDQLSNMKELIRCHKGFAVNVNHIEAFDNSNLFVMKGKEIIEISISGSYRNEVFGMLPKL